MILVKKNNKSEHLGHIWPMYYRTNSLFLQEGPICPANNKIKNTMIKNQSICPWLSSHAQTANVPTSTSSMQVIFPSPSGWEKIRLSGGYTAKPAEHVSVNARARSCNTLSCRKRMLFALSNVSAMAVLSKVPQIYVKATPAQYKDCRKRLANVLLTSTIYNSKILMNLLRLYRWMNCMAKPSRISAAIHWLMFPRSFANVSVKKGQNMASYGSGRKKQIPARIHHWSKNSRNSVATDSLGSCAFQRQRPAADTHRRSFAIPSGNPSDIWKYKALPSKKRQRQGQISKAQRTLGFAGGRSKETSRRKRSSGESVEDGVVWQKEGNRKAYTKAGCWSKDQYLSYGTTQRHNQRPASSIDKTYSCRFSSAADAAIFDMAVARLVQLDKGTLLFAGRDTCDGIGFGRRSLECFELYFVSGSCQRPCTSGL